jgi:hypothetical protein
MIVSGAAPEYVGEALPSDGSYGDGSMVSKATEAGLALASVAVVGTNLHYPGTR